jgi:hypothetical protein
MLRPMCCICNQSPAAVNYIRNNKHYYRKICDGCRRKGKKVKPIPPGWFKAGYRKKHVCDKCGWRAKYPEKQMSVFHIDGNLKNNDNFNLKTVCLNCRVEISMSRLPWKEAEVKPDF